MTLRPITGKPDSLPSLFGDFVDSWGDWVNSERFSKELTIPRVNISENAREFMITVAAPGFEKKDFRISVDGNKLTISAESETRNESTEDRFTHKEYNFSSFSRSFSLPENVEKGKIEATYEGGILKLIVPRKERNDKNPDSIIEVK